jgi:DNA-binding transcriptional ArsR family regulator
VTTAALLDHADELFAALAEPNRRRLLEYLGAHGVATATTLASELPVTRQAVGQHLAVLESVDLVSSARVGRERRYTVHVEPLTAAATWMNQVAAQWDARLAAIKSLAEGLAGEQLSQQSAGTHN